MVERKGDGLTINSLYCGENTTNSPLYDDVGPVGLTVFWQRVCTKGREGLTKTFPLQGDVAVPDASNKSII
jgi:hypothetical protein